MLTTCDFCGRRFEAERGNARFCSDRCRSAYKRLKDRYGAGGEIERQSIFNRKHNFKRIVAIREVANVYGILEGIEQEFGAIAAEKALDACWLVFTGKTAPPVVARKSPASPQVKTPKPRKIVRDTFMYNLKINQYNAQNEPDRYQPMLDRQMDELRVAAANDDPVALELMRDLGLE